MGKGPRAVIMCSARSPGWGAEDHGLICAGSQPWLQHCSWERGLPWSVWQLLHRDWVDVGGNLLLGCLHLKSGSRGMGTGGTNPGDQGLCGGREGVTRRTPKQRPPPHGVSTLQAMMNPNSLAERPAQAARAP